MQYNYDIQHGCVSEIFQGNYLCLLINLHLLKCTENETKFLSFSFQGTDQLTPISDPCLPLNLQYKAKSRKKISHYFIGTGDYLSCQNSLKILLNMTKPCQKEPCSINGIHQSEIDFHNDVFYGFSEFWYTSEDVLRIGGKYNYMKFEKAAKVSDKIIIINHLSISTQVV